MPPSSRVALNDAFCRYSRVSADRTAGPLAASIRLPRADQRRANAAGAASRFRPAAEHRGDRSVSARPRQPHDSEGLCRYPVVSAPAEVLIGRVARGARRAKALSRQGGVM